MNSLEVGLSDFNEAFSALNDKLTSVNAYIDVRAIGGYAMLYNSLREEGYTMDVDTATQSYPEDILKLIREVAREKGIDDDWLNNDALNLDEVKGIIDELEWVEDKSFSHINLYIATLPSLLKLKVRAVDFGGRIPRITDKTDLLDILSRLEIHSIEDIKNNALTSDMQASYPRCFAFLEGQMKW